MFCSWQTNDKFAEDMVTQRKIFNVYKRRPLISETFMRSPYDFEELEGPVSVNSH